MPPCNRPGHLKRGCRKLATANQRQIANEEESKPKHSHNLLSVSKTSELGKTKPLETKMKSLKDSDVWELVRLPAGKKAVGLRVNDLTGTITEQDM